MISPSATTIINIYWALTMCQTELSSFRCSNWLTTTVEVTCYFHLTDTNVKAYLSWIIHSRSWSSMGTEAEPEHLWPCLPQPMVLPTLCSCHLWSKVFFKISCYLLSFPASQVFCAWNSWRRKSKFVGYREHTPTLLFIHLKNHFYS